VSFLNFKAKSRELQPCVAQTLQDRNQDKPTHSVLPPSLFFVFIIKYPQRVAMVSAGDTSLVSRPFPDTADTHQNLPEKRQAPTDGMSDDLEDHLAMSEPENTAKLRNRKPRSDTAKSLDSKVVETSTKATPKVTKGSSRTPKSASKRAKPNPYDPKTVVSSRRSPLTKDHVDLVVSHRTSVLPLHPPEKYR